ncbi:MAG: LysR family transcriptional regulator [Gammaproteobacteria bacterium]|nr:LysR family transcriptional regulator [Gammaproteobacteria bacterium]
MIDWNDLRYFTTVGRTGSLARAARELRVNHSTVFRRINTLENDLGVKLFERTPGGYVLTGTGEEMLTAAARVEEEITALDRRISGRDYRLSGVIRVTTTDTIGFRFVQPHLFQFYQQYPGIRVELVISNDLFSLTKREADIAIRPTQKPPEELVGRRLSDLAWGVYGSIDYFKTKRKPRTPADLAEHLLVGGDDSIAALPAMRWLKSHVSDDNIVYRSNSIMIQAAAVKAGFGLAVLPCFFADIETGLIRVLPLTADLMSELWLLTHRDLRHTARIRAFMEFIAQAVQGDRPLLEGKRRARKNTSSA